MKKMITIFVVAFLSISISTIDFSDLDIGTPDHQDVLSCDTEKNINSILKKDMLNDIKSGYTLRGPIRIDNNTDLSQEAVFNGWNGTGTESDPYIIEGYSIDGGGYGNCLYIGNTTDHFLIRDCHFYNATGKGSFQYFYDSCIYFYNATNGSVKDTNASHSWTSGIYHQYSHRITIDNLTVYYPNQMGQTGIYYFLSENNTVLNSTIISGGYGIKVTSSSDNNVIDNNHIMDVQWNGINIVNSENNTILNNTVEGIYNGMYLWDRSCYNTVYNNDVITNDYGIHVKDNSDYNKIYRNNLINNSVQGADDGTNQWDNGYPYGGNYWGDYSGSDDYCGVNQDISGGDGIGDTAYSIADGSGSDDYPLMKPIKDGRLQRPPFRINSNSDFDAAHGVTDGSGTEGDPWIIEKYHVAGNGVGYCFYVGNTTDHFILRDCILKNASSNPDVYHWNSMIAMYNTQNAMISDNELSSFMTGSSVTADFGIYMNTSDNNRFGDNNISKNENGVYLEYSGYNEFHGCQIFSNERYGMELYSSNNNTIDNTSIHSNDMHGIVIDASDHNKIKNNHIYGNDWAMYIKNSKYNTVSDNNVTGQERYGIHTWGAIENTIKDNLASDNGYHNIYLVGGQDNNVINNTVTKSDNGIYVSSSNRNLIDDNTAHSNHRSGIYIRDSQANTVTNNSMQGEGIILDGAWQYHWDNHFIDDSNSVNGRPVYYWKNTTNGEISSLAGQVILANCTEIKVDGLDLSNGSIGVQVGYSSNITIGNNKCSDNKDEGVNIYRSDNSIITDNIVNNNNGTGISLYRSPDGLISRNTALSNVDHGIVLYESCHNIEISNNTCNYNVRGISIQSSQSCKVDNNDVFYNVYSGIYASTTDHIVLTFNNASYTSDTTSSSGISVGTSNQVTIENNSAWFNNNDGITFGTTDSKISNNTVCNNGGDGMYSGGSFNNISGNILRGNQNGISFSGAENNTIEFNEISYNNVAIELNWQSNCNIIKNNTIAMNNYGVYILKSIVGSDYCKYNLVYHNDFIGNSNQSYDNCGFWNNWDYGYPSGGNYWDGYTGVDEYSGSNQDVPGSDRIGDSAYVIDGSAGLTDDYPLMFPTYQDVFEIELTVDNQNEGWQFISLTVEPENKSLENILSYLEGSYDKLMYYDSSGDRWLTYSPSRADHFNDFTSIDHTHGFWIHMTANDTLMVGGIHPTTTDITLNPGWNMVGYPSGTIGNNELPTEVTKIGIFNASMEYNIAYNYDPSNFIFEPYNAYWIYNGADHEVSWMVEY